MIRSDSCTLPTLCCTLPTHLLALSLLVEGEVLAAQQGLLNLPVVQIVRLEGSAGNHVVLQHLQATRVM